MSINKKLKQRNLLVEKIEVIITPEILTVIIIVCVGLTSFALGRMSAQQETLEPVRLHSLTAVQPTKADTAVVGSRHSDKFHYPWCPGAKRISSENLISFENINQAKQSGYSAAENCPGLEN